MDKPDVVARSAIAETDRRPCNDLEGLDDESRPPHRSWLGRATSHCSCGSGRDRSAARPRATCVPDDAPWPLAAWKPIAREPGFHRHGSRHLGPQDPRARLHPGRRRRTYHLWYTGYAVDRPPTMSLGHATSRDGIHWTRDTGNPIFTDSWVEDVCVVRNDGTFFMFAEGKNDIAHLLTSTDGLKWTDHGSLDIRKTDGYANRPRSLRHAYRLVRKRNLVPLLRAW